MKKNQTQGEVNPDGIGNGVAGAVTHVVLSYIESDEDFYHEIWIGDIDASCHYRNSALGLNACVAISEEIRVGNGNVMLAKKMGKVRCVILQENGKRLIVTFDNVKFVPELWINLFSISKALQTGFNLGNDGEIIKLTKG